MSRRTPVAQVLTEPCLILGVEKPFAILNFMLAMVMAGELHVWAFFLLSMGFHFILRQITRRDPFTRQIYIRYIQQGPCYLPWILATLKPNARPQAYRGVLV